MMGPYWQNQGSNHYLSGGFNRARPIDFHLDAFKKMNISLEDVDGLIVCQTANYWYRDFL